MLQDGAEESTWVGDYQWRVGFIDVEPPGFADVLFGDGNINKTIGPIYGVGNLDDHTSYALITVISYSNQGGKIGISSDDAFKVWLNGKLVGFNAINRSADAKNFQDEFDINLNKGPNLLVVKVSERSRKWAMYVGLDVPDPITLNQTTQTMTLLPGRTLPKEVHLRKISGDAYISEENKDPSFVVEVQDTEGNPMPGVHVKFQIQNKGTTLPRLIDDIIQFAVLDPEIALTDADGRARTTLILQRLDGESGRIKILAYVPKDPKATDPIDRESIADPVIFLATTEAETTIDIKGPWLWMIAEGGPEFIKENLLRSSDSYRAKHGAYKGERERKNDTKEAIGDSIEAIGDSIFWTPGELNEDGDVNECLIQNRMLKGTVDHYTAYALINLRVEGEKWDGVILHVGSDDAVRVWLNGEIVYTHTELRSSDGYQDAIPVNLNLGNNLLMVKVSDHTNGWGLFVGLDVPTDASIKIELPQTPASELQIQEELPLTILPDPPVSKVAFGKESTYFVLTIGPPDFPVYGEDATIYRYKDAIIYDDSLIRLVIEGEEADVSGFIFPLFEENKEESIGELAVRKSIEVTSDLIGTAIAAVATVQIKSLIGTVIIKPIIKPIISGQVSRKVEQELTKTLLPEEENPSFEYPVFHLDVGDSKFMAGGYHPVSNRQKYLVTVINHRLEKLTMSVYQFYRFTFEETTEKTAPLHGTQHDEPLNLKDIWEKENPGQGAPSARPMSLVDYPPFQELPPEVQGYLLQYFGDLANTEAWQIPEVTSLLPNYPNPFNPETWIPYQLSESGDVTLTIYDIHGRVVRDLDLGHQRAGLYHSRSRAAHWDGRNTVGESVASGLYFYTLKAGEFAATRKMLIRK